MRARLLEERFSALERLVTTAKQRQAHSQVVAGALFDKQSVTKIQIERGVRDENHKKDLFTAARQGRTEEEWAIQITALAALPETGSVTPLENENATVTRNEARLTIEIQQEQATLAAGAPSQTAEELSEELEGQKTRVPAKASDRTSTAAVLCLGEFAKQRQVPSSPATPITRVNHRS